MVQEIEKTYDHANLGIVRLQAHELLEILKNNILDSENVIIEVNNIRFNSIEDLASNLSLCQGQPKIYVTNESGNGKTEIEIGEYSTTISSFGSYVGSAHAKYFNILKEFRTFPSRIDNLFFPIYVLSIIMPTAALVVALNVKNINVNFLLPVFALSLLISFVMMFATGHALIFSGGVEYIGKKGLFRRNLDKIFIGIVTLLVGTMLGLLIRFLLE